MRFPSKDAFQATLRRWGINDDSSPVLHDDSRTALVSRLYFLLALDGFPMEQVKVLNGGTVEWTAFNERGSVIEMTTHPHHALPLMDGGRLLFTPCPGTDGVDLA